MFSVKSAYHIATNVQKASEASESGINSQKNRWRSIWDLNIIPRAKIGLWKIIKNLIPSKQNLLQRGMDINQVCDLCRCAKESPDHLFWRCKKVRKIWERFFPNLTKTILSCRPGMDMGDAWEIIFKHHSKEEWERIGIIIWTIWNFRNQVAVNKQNPE